MAATVATYVYTGVAPGSGASATNIRFKLADNNTQDSNNPNVKPTVGNNNSFWKTIALYCTVAPSTAINNVKLYTDGALAWTGCTVYVGDQMTDTYAQGVVDPGDADSGYEMTNHSQITTKTDLFTYTSGSPMSITLSASWANVTGRITMYVVVQLTMGTTATGGAQAAETLTWQYDET